MAAAAAIAAAGAGLTAAQSAPRVIKVSTKKFEFVPRVIEVAVGESIVLELTALDVNMGIDIPDLNLREDIIPGQVRTLKFTATRKGEIDFHCDIFCGDDHEDMGGKIVVS